MGILEIHLLRKWEKNFTKKPSVKSIAGGTEANLVPELCIAILEIDEIQKGGIKKSINEIRTSKNISISLEENGNVLKIICNGISAHGGNLEEGLNAISQMMMVLENLDIESGELKLNIGVIKLDTDGVEIKLNVRYPITAQSKLVIDNMRKNLVRVELKLL